METKTTHSGRLENASNRRSHSGSAQPGRSRRRRAALVAGIVGGLLSALIASSASASVAPHAGTAVVAATSPDPSGQPIPTQPPSGYTTVSAQDFNGTTLPSGWTAYNGKPGGDAVGWWSPSHVSVSGGMLHLLTSEGTQGTGGPTGEVSGGVGTGITQSYGEYEVRMRMDGGAGVDGIALLWPTVGWPPEIDFFEDGQLNNARTTITGNLHYAPNNQRIHVGEQNIDFTQWHTVGVIWSPGTLQYTLDGKVWATTASTAVPTQPMSLDLQTQFDGGTLTAPTPADVSMDIDWVAVYAPA